MKNWRNIMTINRDLVARLVAIGRNLTPPYHVTMQTRTLTRRAFVVSSSGLVLLKGAGSLVATDATGLPASLAITAQEIADRIRTSAGAPARPNTVDGIKAGDPATVITGVATTVVASIDVLKRAAAAKQNFIVAHEPTFYGANDDPGPRAQDPLYLAKKALIDEHKLVIYRLYDQWNGRTPNEAEKALAAELGLQAGLRTYTVPPTTLGELAAQVRAKLGAKGGVRIVGQPSLAVLRVGVLPGTTTVPQTMEAFRWADVVIAGEPREWEAVPYTYDAIGAGQTKGMIVLGRVLSEGPGMKAAAAWIKSLVPEVPVTALATPDPYWSAS
jgi:putative NIF3 family GTP cyclohydrolase 1 type 2